MVPRLLRVGLFLLLGTSSLVAADALDPARVLLEDRDYEAAKGMLAGMSVEEALDGERLILLTQACNELQAYEEAIAHGE